MSKIPSKNVKILERICQSLFDKKGFNILTLDVRGVSTLTDYFVIAEGNVSKHVQSLAREVVDVMREEGQRPIHVEGLTEGDWVVLDFADIVIHLFIPDFREKYALEKLWHEAKVVDVPIRVTA